MEGESNCSQGLSTQTDAWMATRFAVRVRNFRASLAYFALRRQPFHPIERDMGQQHRVRVKRKRRSAYLDRKKAAAKAAPVRREAPKAKAKPKKQAAAAPET
jgi:hypothetical protein